MKANWKLGHYCVVQDNVWCSRPLLQPSPLIYPRPQHPAPRGRGSHIFSKSKESRPYLKFPQFKARGLDRTGEPQSLMTLGPKSPLDSESVALGILKEMAVKWFAETQAELLLHTGRLPEWFHGFVLRKEAEKLLQNKGLGHFLIRLSDRATGYILSYRGSDRCRHFVIHRLKDGRYMIDGSNHTHRGLAALIDYYMTEAIQPFGEVLTQACRQYDGSDVYDHISISTSSGSSCWPELEVREVAAWRPLAGGPQPRQRDAPNERQRRRPPAIPPKASRMSNNEKMAALVNIPISCEDASATPTLPDETSRLFGDENQVEAKYGQVQKSGCRSPRVPALGEGAAGWTSVTTPLPSDQSKDRGPPHPQWEPNDVIYSLAVEPQPRCNQPLASETVDVVYTEVQVGQWREATGSVAPDTPPRLSPNINTRVKPPSPSHSPHKATGNPRPTSHPPLPHPPNAALTASRSGKMSSVSTDNTYQHVAVAPSKRSQAKPDKDETRKRWYSDWKCK